MVCELLFDEKATKKRFEEAPGDRVALSKPKRNDKSKKK